MMLLKQKKAGAARVLILVALATVNPACGSSGGAGSPPADTVNDNQAIQPVVEVPVMRSIPASHGISMQLLSERADRINPKLVYAFQGKGTALTWDIGVTRAAYERIPMLRGEANAQGMAAGDVVLTGNSSGSVLAAWFSCRGITADSIKGAETIMSGFPAQLVKEDPAAKFQEVLGAINSGKEFGSPTSDILPLVDAIVGNGACVPRLPTVILASNQDINDNRRWLFTEGRRSRSFDITDFSYSQRTGDFSLEKEKVGKICTYFADPVMFRYLSENMTGEERLCDIRVMENADDMRTAVLASISEPTYFVPVEEKAESKLVRFDAPGAIKSHRFYNGGFSMPGIVQDIKRLFPAARAMGTGRWTYNQAEVAVMYSWYDVNLNSLQEQSRWWMDLEPVPTDTQRSRLLARPAGLQGADLAARYQEEINLGYQRATACLQPGKACLSPRTSIFGRDPNKPAFTRPAGQPGGAEIPTRQGLDMFLQ
ncbi:hypothetical protein EBZ80_00125 [bacterium]|nr:hypothetical protein [bacterium]